MTTSILILRHPSSAQEPTCSSLHFTAGKVAEGRWWRDLSAAWGSLVAHPEKWAFLCKYNHLSADAGAADVGLGRVIGASAATLAPSELPEGLVTTEGSDVIWRGLFKENIAWLRKLPVLRFYDKSKPQTPWRGPGDPPRILTAAAAALALSILDGADMSAVLADYAAARAGLGLPQLDLAHPGTWEMGS